MLTMAITGGIGSGKSFVSEMLSATGLSVYDTDRELKRLYGESPELKSSLKRMFGKEVYSRDGTLDRRKMAAAVFSDSSLLNELEQMAYPFLVRDLKGWICRCRDRGENVAVIESALILEKEQFRSLVDKVVTVSAPENLRVRRAAMRGNVDEGQVEARMKRQKTDKWREARADYIIINDGRPLLPQIDKILKEIIYGLH